MPIPDSIAIARPLLAQFCKLHGVRRLSLFGSALTPSFRTDSDIDLLIEFEPDMTPSLLKLAALERDISSILGGRRVDLRTSEDLSRYFRTDILNSAQFLYGQE
jgi:predicted nucleotidyltransferase